MSKRPVVIVVGAGFSGLLTALHLLSAPDGPQVRLLERRGVFGRGRAYATDNPHHLLNVRTANMSAFPDRPDHFVRWLAQSGGPDGFVTRGRYGEYLQSLLGEAVQGAFGPGRLLLEVDEAVDARPAPTGGWQVETAMGRTLPADAVVLALGSLAPAPPRAATPQLLASPRYVADPWTVDASAELGRRILLLGAGLTMVDVAFALDRPGRRLTALSRRGLLPRAHDARPPAAPSGDIVGTPLDVLRETRALAAAEDWRGVVDRVRGSASRLWRSWPPVQRRRFLRHLRPWWEVHRHRMAPQVARRIETMRGDARLTVRAGAVQRLDLVQERVRLEWRPRGGGEGEIATFDAVVNCTGLSGDIRRVERGLLRALFGRGLIRADACELGLDVDVGSRPLGAAGQVSPGLYAVGPLTRGAFWEVTSVPDIRPQAAEIAGEILHFLASEGAAARSA